MKKPKSERTRLLHEKLDKYKDDILNDKAEGKTNRQLSVKYGINEFTVADWVYFWQNGTKRRRLYTSGKRKLKKREFSKQLKTMMKINSEYNKRLIKHIKVNNGQDEKMIRYICGVKV